MNVIIESTRCMYRTLLCFLMALPFFAAGQLRPKEKKYPSLLWEISGRDLKKPSFLFGTMHVSNKMVFQLADSFYIGIRKADVVALETNPESWQEDMSRYNRQAGGDGIGRHSFGTNASATFPDEYLNSTTLQFYRYHRKIERALSSNPDMINNLLYRTYGERSSDFEEDTYLDMYIYQCGKKWGKRVAGVEKYEESMKLMAEAYRDAAREKKRKERSYDADEGLSQDRLQEAYRNGNLDLLDSINRFNSVSEAFDEKFLYRRNEIQARSIDSILRTSSSLFVGVGAAHLPGERGVIELLRNMGYRLRPVKMGERDSHHKTEVEKIRVPVSFSTWTADDGFIKVDIPGKFYRFGDDGGLDQRQYADMANGAYYMVTRIMTNAWMWGHSSSDVYKKVDSLLYENVPGRIISRTTLLKNGYRGIALINRTRRGDIQRYQIFVTPFEILFFKISGTGDYVLRGEEANRFFNSIQLREYKPDPSPGSWKRFSPAEGGFSAEFPHEPYRGNDGSWIYDAEDKASGTHYRVIRSDIHNYSNLGEDSFDLRLMEESFAASSFIDTQLSRRPFLFRGYPALDAIYRGKEKGRFLVRFLIQGPHYFTIVAHGDRELPVMGQFLNSFRVEAPVYAPATLRTDTALFYSVMSPVFPGAKAAPPGIPRFDFSDDDGEEDTGEAASLENGVFRSRVISNDTTGEKILVSFFRAHRYFEIRDTLNKTMDRYRQMRGGDALIVRKTRAYETSGNYQVLEREVTDSSTSRALWTKSFYRDGLGFSLVTEYDTLTGPSRFVQRFYDSFKPSDTVATPDPHTRKAPQFFADLASSDSVTHQRAVRMIDQVYLDSSELPALQSAISRLQWQEKKYVETKKSLIARLAGMPTRAAADYLRSLYFAAGDTVEIQHQALEALLKHKTRYAYSVFRDIITTDPPVIENDNTGRFDWDDNAPRMWRDGIQLPNPVISFSDGNFLDELFDSLALTRTLLPDLLSLLTIHDYEKPVRSLLVTLVDSNLLTPADYQAYFNKFMLEARQELKKQLINEKNAAIKKAEDRKDEGAGSDDEDDDDGNEDLVSYATLLLPFADGHPAVTPFVNQLLGVANRQLKYETMLLLIRNKKPVPDSLLLFFARMDDYRYRLYRDLRKFGAGSRFPAAFNKHLALATSRLLDEQSYSKPDSVQYLDRLPARIKNINGFVYFFKYKAKRDDPSWKIGMVGLVPVDSSQFEFPPETLPVKNKLSEPWFPRLALAYRDYDVTAFTGTRLAEDEPVATQLARALKKALYSKHPSAREFYEGAPQGYDASSSN